MVDVTNLKFDQDMSFTMSNLAKTYSILKSILLKPRFILFSLFSLLILIKIISVAYDLHLSQTTNISNLSITVNPPKWLEIIKGNSITGDKRALRVGLINFDVNQQSRLLLDEIADPVTIDLQPVSPNVTWNELYPEGATLSDNSTCPEIPMPNAREYPALDVVVARLPCGEGNNNVSHIEGIRNVHRLQLSLASAHLIVENAITNGSNYVYGVFISKCEPMVEIFRCDDLLWHQGDYWIYKPKVDKLMEILSMPLGSCGLARPYVGTQGRIQLQVNSTIKRHSIATLKPKEAYVTVLHSSESFVCGAVALAQSILLTNTTKDLVLLADQTITNYSIAGLQAAGWKVKRIERIRSPYANLTDYNAWNYSKLRIWQLIEYSKVMFIDSDFIVLRNLDHFFNYPQLSARSDHGFYFNSGIMLLEPSECFFETLMNKMIILMSYNGGDQGYLNEVLTHWHRFSWKLSSMKYFLSKVEGGKRVVPEDPYTIHFFGLKPWTCYRDYDCNWDREDLHIFASDQFHALWWKIYDAMTKKLQMHCGMTKNSDTAIQEWRVSARLGNHSNGHWNLDIKDPRQFNLIDAPEHNYPVSTIRGSFL